MRIVSALRRLALPPLVRSPKRCLSQRTMVGVSVNKKIPSEEACVRLLNCCASAVVGPFVFMIGTGLQAHNRKGFKYKYNTQNLDAKTVAVYKQALCRLHKDIQARIRTVLFHEHAAKPEYVLMVQAVRAAFEDTKNAAFRSSVLELAQIHVAKRARLAKPDCETHVINYIIDELPSTVVGVPSAADGKPFERIFYGLHDKSFVASADRGLRVFRTVREEAVKIESVRRAFGMTDAQTMPPFECLSYSI